MYDLAIRFMSGLMFEEAEAASWDWIDTIVSAINTVLWPILIVVGAAGMLYAVVIGVNMARADSTEKREEAKKRLVNVIVGLAIIVALILFFQLLISEGGILDQIFPNMR